ncbi:rhodanese-like domain-containing protein [Vibrio sp. MarTm2]|uniref:rhodanese-like domain-containing protein n=1 Tax=Vibrio sp. MarTm2 TaxID=2998831 RepID=UPI0022CD8A81|nr:rhodanese-like domain-containing protein [Vibrio sp. MarTm2]MDA0128056.1 rhodanese-like domain-containing protein [Vibrio sp. MarTm2]
MKKWLIVFFISAALLTSPVFASERADIGWEWIEQGAVVVDVRTPQEFAAGHLDNAKNYPLSELDKHFANIDKDTQIVLYCRSGNRSGQAFRYLQSQGFTNLHNAGGLVEMQQAK